MTHRHHRTPSPSPTGDDVPLRRLEVVLKADTRGTLEAVAAAAARVAAPGVEVAAIERGIGDVAKSDLVMATTGSRLVLGFDVGLLPKGEEFAREHGVEVRLYEVVDHLARDLAEIARALVPPPPQERILGKARVVALFKGVRKGVILGCEVLDGRIALGMAFRVIDPAGPVHEGVVESLHIERDAVREARPGQRVGLQVRGFTQGRVGDLVECFEAVKTKAKPWSPRPGVVRVRA